MIDPSAARYVGVMDSHYDRLVRLFAVLLAPTATACSTTGEIDTSQFDHDLCDEDGRKGFLANAVFDQDADYAEWRRAMESYDGVEPTVGDATILESVGDRCSGASDAPACNAAFDALPVESQLTEGGWDFSYHHSLGITRGDEVIGVIDRAGLLELLGDIDAPGDAALLVTLDGHDLVCRSSNDVGVHEDGFVVHTRSGTGCGDDIEEHVVLVHTDGTVERIESVVVEKGDPNCAIGRLPAGLCRRVRRTRALDPVGRFFGEVATLEAAAVTAFQQLGRELDVHGAPVALRAAARRSARDEVRHARATARLARRFGGRAVAPRVAAHVPRSLEAVAADNAAEGCIRETYGALVAHAQARRVRDPELRRVLTGIARDETRHAALSWTLRAWTEARLDPAARRRVARSTASALERLEAELTASVDPRVVEVAGMPTPREARALYRGLHGTLFRA